MTQDAPHAPVRTDLTDEDLRAAWGWIHSSSYWAADIPWETFLRACRHSVCFGAYENGRLIGFARVVTDHATFAWLCDVMVDEAARGRGIGKALVAAALSHPDVSGLRRWGLATADAHGLYAQSGFVQADPTRHMERVDRDVYRRPR